MIKLDVGYGTFKTDSALIVLADLGASRPNSSEIHRAIEAHLKKCSAWSENMHKVFMMEANPNTTSIERHEITRKYSAECKKYHEAWLLYSLPQTINKQEPHPPILSNNMRKKALIGIVAITYLLFFTTVYRNIL